MFGICRAGAVWCRINRRNEAAENRDLLDLFDCPCLFFQATFAALVTKILPDLRTWPRWSAWTGSTTGPEPFAVARRRA